MASSNEHLSLEDGGGIVSKLKNKRTLTDSPSRPSLVIIGRRWFDKQNGNTYHTSQIIINGRIAYKTDFAYGYDDAYVDTAAEWLEKEGYIERERYQSGMREPLWRYCQERNITLTYMAFDVRKKDL